MSARSTGGRGSFIAKAAVIGLLTLVLAWFALANAVATATHRRNAELALRFVNDDPVALTTRAGARLVQLRERAVGDAEIVTLARRSIAENPLNPTALRLIGVTSAQQAGPAGQRAMELAHRMTRRDLVVELWLIESAVARNDVPGVLRHYDNALRTAEESQQVLFPVLTTALLEREIWPNFIPYMREPAPWLGDFMRHAIRNTREPVTYAELIRRAGGLPRDTVFASLEAELLKRMVDTGSVEAAARYYASMPGADPQVPSSAVFSERAIDPRYAPLTWEIYQSGGANSAFVRTDNGGLELRATVEPGNDTALARKVVLMRPGPYRFRAEQWAASGNGAAATWELMCVNGNQSRPFWRETFPLTQQRRALAASIEVPGGCSVYTLRLLGSATEPGTEIVAAATSLQPAGR